MYNTANDNLAKTVVHYSLKLKPGEKVLIQGMNYQSEPLVSAIVKEAKAIGAHPVYRISSAAMHREWLTGIDTETLELATDIDMYQMNQLDAYVGITAPDNALELADVPGESMKNYQILYNEPVIQRIIVEKTRWVILSYPTAGFAQSARMSTQGFAEWYFRVCSVDYSRMSRAIEPLKALMERTDRVQIRGPGETDLFFSIKGIPAVACTGEYNIPDGEIFTAPVKDSVNGVIAYNTKTIREGFEFSNIRFRFENGKIIEATANDTERINTILDIDEGARYIGEFAIGVNPHIQNPINSTLFDEKIRGSIHFTPGKCYSDASNGNQSSLHWDIVLLQEEQHGGGEIYFDDVLIRKDGRFIVSDLEALNPENLTSS